MDWLPGQTRDPLGMAAHGVAHRRARLRVPHADVRVVSPGGEPPLAGLPRDAEDPPPVAREHVRGRLGAEVPQAGVRVARACGEEAPSRGKRRAEDGRAVACGRERARARERRKESKW